MLARNSQIHATGEASQTCILVRKRDPKSPDQQRREGNARRVPFSHTYGCPARMECSTYRRTMLQQGALAVPGTVRRSAVEGVGDWSGQKINQRAEPSDIVDPENRVCSSRSAQDID